MLVRASGHARRSRGKRRPHRGPARRGRPLLRGRGPEGHGDLRAPRPSRTRPTRSPKRTRASAMSARPMRARRSPSSPCSKARHGRRVRARLHGRCRHRLAHGGFPPAGDLARRDPGADRAVPRRAARLFGGEAAFGDGRALRRGRGVSHRPRAQGLRERRWSSKPRLRPRSSRSSPARRAPSRPRRSCCGARASKTRRTSSSTRRRRSRRPRAGRKARRACARSSSGASRGGRRTGVNPLSLRELAAKAHPLTDA